MNVHSADVAPFITGDIFLRQFGEFERSVRRLLHAERDRPLSQVLREGFRRHPSLLRRRDIIDDIVILRNVIAHGTERVGKALPTRETARELDELVAFVRTLEQGVTLFLKRAGEAPREFAESEQLIDALAFMARREYSQVPVRLNDGGVGLLTAIDISEWLASKVNRDEAVIDLSEHIVGEVVRAVSGKFSIVARNAIIGDVEDQFIVAIQTQYDNLYCVLVTQNGRASEKTLGIITSWDLMNLPEVA